MSGAGVSLQQLLLARKGSRGIVLFFQVLFVS